MRDFDRVRDKIEIRLEPRQVVLLAGGTMLFSGLLFAAGFMLGRSRTPAVVPVVEIGAVDAAPAPVADTATRTTRASAIGEVEFRFPTELGSRPARVRAERPTMRLAPEVVSGGAGEKREPAPVVPAPARVEPLAARVEPARVEPARVEPARAEPARVEPARIEPARAEPARVDPPRIEPIKPAPRAAAAEPIDEDDPDAGAPAAPAAVVAPPATAARENTGNRYTLQVKAARDKAEADAFIAALRRAGYKPHVVLADVPGKGRFYRVRVGRFASMAEAREFQRSYKMKTGEPDGGFVTDL
ncbi:MAG: SPOR domain-containing protein [bacterium]